tara:strand:+ start:15872 stop:18112 length:2241 start_codon:yes stop_codon:yes gene_type:complete
MSKPTSERFRRILEAARKRDGQSGTDTMIVNSHLAQMKLFMLRQGLEFYPAQDTFGFRKVFLNDLIIENEIDSRLEGIVDDFLIDGKGLFYFRPIGDSYRIMWFSKDNYRAYYDAEGELEEIELIYSFNVKNTLGPLAMPGDNGSMRYVKLQVKRDLIKESITNERPSFDGGPLHNGFSGNKTRTLTNSLGFIPAVESFNTMRSTGMDASGDFDWLADQIVLHDDLVKNIRTNIHFFGNPTLVSSRPKHDLVESGDEEQLRPTISSQAGFFSADRASTRVSQPTGGSAGGMKVPRLIANVEPTDRAVYLTPDAVSGDQNLYARQYREEVRTALGGVDELGISSGATAYEIKSLYGRAATTAARRCRGLLTYGLCKLLSLIVYHEEQIFRESFAVASGMIKPQPPLEEVFDDPQLYRQALAAYAEQKPIFENELEIAMREAIQNTELPPGVVGLVPDGDRKIEWRWKGPVFEDSTEDILNSSIVVRNLQELGVNSIEALRHLFPNKTDEERSAMLSGYPFRMAQATQSSIGTFLSLIDNMRRIPHPQAPDLPMLSDPKLDLTPFVYRAMDYLKRELTYAGQYNDSTSYGDPTTLDTIERARVDAGLPASSSPERPTFTPDSYGGIGSAGGSTGGSTGGESLAGGVQPLVREPEHSAALPTSGSLLNSDPTDPESNSGLAGSNKLSGRSIRFGDPDLMAPSNAGLYPSAGTGSSTPAPASAGTGTGAELADRAKRTRDRRVSRKRKQR